MIVQTDSGLYCEAGDFYIDPMKSVERAVITHAHSDHARRGMKWYLCHHHTKPLLNARLGRNLSIESVGYGEERIINGVQVSFHPAGHVAGSSQIRLEYKGEVWVASGDYKRDHDPFASPFEPIKCHVFLTESTFGLPVYNWPVQQKTFEHINAWWNLHADNQVPCVMSAYSLGKAQHILGCIDRSIGPLFVHPAVQAMNDAMRASGLNVPETSVLTSDTTHAEVARALIISPSIGDGPDWMQADNAVARGRASGWFAVRRAGRQQSGEQGFVLSDHADWPSLLRTVKETECERVLVNHGFSAQLAHHLTVNGYQAEAIDSRIPIGKTSEDQKSRNPEEWKPVSKIHKFIEEQTGFDQYIIDQCQMHVGHLAETVALLLPKELALPEFFGKRMIEQVKRIRVPRFARNDNSVVLSMDADEVLRSPFSVLLCVLMHVHLRTGGRRGFDKFTMGVWSGDELVPLVHVAVDIEPELADEISEFTKEHTLVKSGPVRTIEPRFVFKIELKGITPAPRRKCGVAVAEARIKEYVKDAEPNRASKLHDISIDQ